MLLVTAECGGGNSAAERGPGPRRGPMSSCGRGQSSAPAHTGDQWPAAATTSSQAVPVLLLWSKIVANVRMNFISLHFCQDFVVGPGLKRFRAFSRLIDGLKLKQWISEYRTEILTHHTAGRIFLRLDIHYFESMTKCMSRMITKCLTDRVRVNE